MYYFKLLKTNQKGELVSPYGKGLLGRPYIWKIGEWRKTQNFFSASETIIDALSAVWIGHFSVISRVEIKDYNHTGESLFTEIISKEMRIVEAYLWPESLDCLIERKMNRTEIASGLTIVQPSNTFFKNLSLEEKKKWESFFVEAMKKFVPYNM